MSIGRYLGYAGGILAIVAGIVSIATRKPLASYIFGLTLVEGNVLIIMGLIGLLGGLVAIYYSYRGNGLYVIIGGILGLLAPCALSILAVIGGYLMLRSKPGE